MSRGHTGAPAGGGCGQRVLHLEGDLPAVGGGDVGSLHEDRFLGAFGKHQVTIAIEGCFAAACEMEGKRARGAIHAEEDHLAGALLGHFDGEGVVGVEHAVAGFGDAFDDHLLDAGQVLGSFDAVEAEVVGG